MEKYQDIEDKTDDSFCRQQERHTNSISLIKLLAAFQVMFGHIKAHLLLSVPAPVNAIIGYFKGVPIFFVLSGFLIWNSVYRSKDYRSYIKKRFWRIYPELWACIVVEIISILIFYNGWNVRDLSLFAISQGSILQFWTPKSLRAYGCGTPNGTLWTICVTIQFYVFSWGMYKALQNKNRCTWLAYIILGITISIIGEKVAQYSNHEIIVKLYDLTLFRYGWLFLIGMFVAEYSKEIMPIISNHFYVPLLLGLVPYFFHFDLNAGYGVFSNTLMVLGLLGFAYEFPKLAVEPDVSYSIFLYHMIIVNIAISVGWTGIWGYGILVVVISCLLAYISTMIIGSWSAKQKSCYNKAAHEDLKKKVYLNP